MCKFIIAAWLAVELGPRRARRDDCGLQLMWELLGDVFDDDCARKGGKLAGRQRSKATVQASALRYLAASSACHLFTRREAAA
jgi:hypothetical protein